MHKGRLEAFSDGVLAIVITIMVLEIKVPHGGGDLSALRPLLPIFLSYVVSFVFIGIYWNNHHHMMQAINKINGNVLWANLHLLFWISLIPFGTAWVGENGFASWPVAIYGVILLCAGVAYYILTHVLIACPDTNPKLAQAVGRDLKGKISVVIYACAIPLAFVSSAMAYFLYCSVAALWLYPDSRIERTFER